MDNIYDYCLTEKTAFEMRGVLVAGDWEWSMYKHINYSILMKNSQFPITQTVLGERPYKNIIRPILNVAYRSEGFDVKDIEPYVNDAEYYHLSFLARKFHEDWALENDIDTFIDEVVETYVDYGGVLVKNVNQKRPAVIPWQSVAFVDQTNILGGTIALKHSYSVDELKDAVVDMKWYADAVNQAIASARSEKTNSQSANTTQALPSKNVEVFEIHGTFPKTWLMKDGEGNEEYNSKLSGDGYSKQLHIITYITDPNGDKKGICLFKGPEKKSIFKFLNRDKIFGRALGFGGVEELFEAQIWTNFDEVHMQNMLKEASKVIQVTNDAGFTTRNNTKNTKGGEVFVIEDGKEINQLNTQPINMALFEKASQSWEQHARVTGSASDPALGINPVSGTPLGTTQIVTDQGEGIHEYRQGKVAAFMGEIYRDWVIDYLVADMNKGLEWADELSLEEMQKLAEDVMTNQFNDYIKKKILSGQMVSEEELAPLREQFKKEFMKSSTKFLKILQGEFESKPMKVKFNIAGKQKNLAKMADKLSNIFKTIFANPQGFIQTMQIPGAAEAFNSLLEASGLKQMDFSTMPAQMTAPQQSPAPVQIPQKALPVNT